MSDRSEQVANAGPGAQAWRVETFLSTSVATGRAEPNLATPSRFFGSQLWSQSELQHQEAPL
jgi:hypothetical protein